ncbi:DUF4142 domain-containing protein [Desertivirga xinjiangensis]|uniref:DUF4142 domain-containing protein n=1 Tax=Desertivirga xinjiangensis TaxID=539206 RepID=UPI00210EB5DE|nr:DUF4142 domain-containing protein [Pedobacter xinjiangensis]
MITDIYRLCICLFCCIVTGCNSVDQSLSYLPEGSTALRGTSSEATNTTAIIAQQQNASIDSASAEFAKQACISNKLIIQLSLLAKERSQSSIIPAFAETTITQYRKAESTLEDILREKGIPSDSHIPANEQDGINKLYTLKSHAFDKSYLDLMEQAHRRAIAVYKKGATKPLDNNIKTYAQERLPDIEAQYDALKEIERSVKSLVKDQ